MVWIGMDLHLLMMTTYGVDWDGPSPADDDNTDAVVLPQTNSPLLPTKLAELRTLLAAVIILV